MIRTSERTDLLSATPPVGGGMDAAVREGETVAGRPVSDVMSSPVFAVPSCSTLGDVLRAMLHTGRRHVVVLDLDGRFLGVLGDRAVAAAWANDPSALSEELAGQLVGRERSVVGPQATLQDAAAVMIRDTVDAVAVVDPAGHPVGIVTGGDLVALLARVCLPGPTAATPIPRPA